MARLYLQPLSVMVHVTPALAGEGHWSYNFGKIRNKLLYLDINTSNESKVDASEDAGALSIACTHDSSGTRHVPSLKQYD